MKKYAFLLIAALLIFGCRPLGQGGATLVKINNYEISKDEFEQDFLDSAYGRDDSLESRKEFLNWMISRKLILLAAQRQGLDKEKSFLKMIERYWEQSLVKLKLDKESQQISGSVVVSDKEIKEAYDKMYKEGKTSKAYEQIYPAIKLGLVNAKETQALNEWVNVLHKEAKIKINYDLLEKNK